MGTAIGTPPMAAELRITAAVFGLFWPTRWPRRPGGSPSRSSTTSSGTTSTSHEKRNLALFDAFVSKDKTLHANAGQHKELPRFEVDSAVHFFVRRLGGPTGLT